jgi:CRP-like cAMP-binding protein
VLLGSRVVDGDRKARRKTRRPPSRDVDPQQVALLGESLLFESLSEDRRRLLASKGAVHVHRPGEIIVREGEEGDSLYLVVSGRVRMLIERDGAVVELGSLARPACFGEASVLSGTARAETIEALEPTRVVCYGREHVLAITRRYPEVRKRIEASVLGRAKAALHAIERRRG